MTTLQRSSLLTIGEVARRTGVSSSTLRAWERRYGVPQPSRTPSGYRLYDQDALNDIAALRNHQRSGVRPQQAALCVKRAEGSARVAGTANVRAWRRRLTAACVRFNSATAHAVIAEASQAVGAMATLKLALFPVVAALGDRWRRGVINVSQEHYASQLAQRMVMSLTSQSADERRATILSGCAPGERHELGLLLLVAELRARGHRVVHLGCDVPVGAFLAALDSLEARIAIVGATISAHMTPWSARQHDVRRRTRRGVQFIWGGPGASKGAGKLSGLVTNSFDDAFEVVAESLAPRSHEFGQDRCARVI